MNFFPPTDAERLLRSLFFLACPDADGTPETIMHDFDGEVGANPRCVCCSPADFELGEVGA